MVVTHVNVTQDIKVMVSHVLISMNVLLVITIVTRTPVAQTPMVHSHVAAIPVLLETAKIVLTSMNVQQTAITVM